MNPEGVSRVNVELEKDYELINNVLCDYFDGAKGAALIDDDLEKDLYITDYADVLNAFLVDEASQESWEAIYRAIHFAFSVNRLLGCGAAIAVGAQLDELQRSDPLGQREAMTEAMQCYMAQNSYLDDITGAYMPELDPQHRFADVVETVVALVSVQIQYAKDAEIASEQIAGWDGGLDELL
jgi:hypothetical protein